MEQPIYRPGKKLINILLDIGFEDVTEILYPNHYTDMERTGYYMPGSIKRAFFRDKVIVRFDYTHIFIEYKESKFRSVKLWDGYQIKDDELFSYISSPKYYIKQMKLGLKRDR